ncbi:MAG TPA: glycosyltransferase family 39 protein, partial [Stellaceae bacterium]|nr:glycosyltransferase family 39 protein [Stellaceae bacterium]
MQALSPSPQPSPRDAGRGRDPRFPGPREARPEDRLWRGRVRGFLRRGRPFALLALLCLLLYAPGLAAIPPLDRDEARFAQATRQMLESGDFIRIRFQDHARNKKPAGIYWLQAASVSLFSTAESPAIWPYRLPSALAAALAALLVLALGRALFADGRRAGLLAGVLMASALGLVAEAHLAKTDAALCAAIVAGQGALGLAYVRARAGFPVGWPLALGFWFAEAAGVLLKGPVAPLIAFLTAGALALADRDARFVTRLRPVVGLCVTAAVVLPWLVAIERATAGHFLAQSVGHDLLPKLLGGQEGHGAPPGTYLALSLVTFWPGSLLLVPALVWGRRQRRAPAERFLLAWLIPAWLLFELIPTKLPHYVLPLYPALALLAGRALAEGFTNAQERGSLARKKTDAAETAALLTRIADRVVRGLWGLASFALAAALVVLPVIFGHGPPAAAIPAAAAIALLAAALLSRGPAIAPLASLSVAFALGAAAVLPGLDRIWPSRAAAALVARHPPSAGTPLVAIGDSEPSLVFLLGTKTRLLSAPAAAPALARG